MFQPSSFGQDEVLDVSHCSGFASAVDGGLLSLALIAAFIVSLVMRAKWPTILAWASARRVSKISSAPRAGSGRRRGRPVVKQSADCDPFRCP